MSIKAVSDLAEGNEEWGSPVQLLSNPFKIVYSCAFKKDPEIELDLWVHSLQPVSNYKMFFVCVVFYLYEGRVTPIESKPGKMSIWWKSKF